MEEEKLGPFAKIPEDRTAVDNILRINHGNQMRLGLMADAKANIMITVASVVFSVAIANLDNELVKCVADNRQALAYFGYAYYKNNTDKLKAVKIVNPKDNAVMPSVKSVQNEKYRPLSRPLFLYINDHSLRKNKPFRQFISYYLRNISSLVTTSNYIPLPDATYRLVDSKKYRHILGTSFGGNLPVGLTIGQAIDRSFDQHKTEYHR